MDFQMGYQFWTCTLSWVYSWNILSEQQSKAREINHFSSMTRLPWNFDQFLHLGCPHFHQWMIFFQSQETSWKVQPVIWNVWKQNIAYFWAYEKKQGTSYHQIPETELQYMTLVNSSQGLNFGSSEIHSSWKDFPHLVHLAACSWNFHFHWTSGGIREETCDWAWPFTYSPLVKDLHWCQSLSSC